MAAGGAYRADIDGLRAIAVLSVALFHGGIPGFSGGFIGVDVFFVISGFLITRIIAEAATEDRFSYWAFYERRARRILPALFVVAAAVSIFTLLYRSPRDAEIFGESVTFFAFFAANFFYYNQLDYFADPVEFYPLLHMWSLAVEEQFYLFFPPLFLALWAGFRRRMLLALAALAALSFVASVIAVAYDPQLAFFHTPFRMWQLMAGGLLAIAPPFIRTARAREAAAAIGLILLLAPIPLYDHDTPFPGLAALPPTLGTALVIAAGIGAERPGAGSRVARWLSWRPMVFVGLCSYSFYLWHWPALAAARYLSFEPLSLFTTVLVLTIAFGVSVLSLYLIERPFRRSSGGVGADGGLTGGGVLTRRGVFAASAAGIGALLILGWALQESKGWPGRFPTLAPIFAEDARRYGPHPAACAPALDQLPRALREKLDPGFCQIHDPGPGAPAAVFWGDSHLWALAPALRRWAEKNGVAAYVGWSAICPPLLGYERGVATRWASCVGHNDALAETAAALGADRAVLVAQWSRYAPRTDLAAALESTASALRAQGVQPIIITEAPPVPGHAPTLLFRAAATGAALPIPTGRVEREAPIAGADKTLRAAAGRLGAPVVDLGALLCPARRCAVAAADGAPLYADSHHLNRRGAAFISEALAEALDRAR